MYCTVPSKSPLLYQCPSFLPNFDSLWFCGFVGSLCIILTMLNLLITKFHDWYIHVNLDQLCCAVFFVCNFIAIGIGIGVSQPSRG